MLRFKVGGTTVIICFSFLAILAFLMSMCGQEVLLASLFAAVFHESGHLLIMKMYSMKINRVMLYGAGIKIKYYKTVNMGILCETAVIMSGCCVNFILAGILFFIPERTFYMTDFMNANIAVGIFNLMPVKCFDGGRFLRMIYEHTFHSYRTVCIFENIISVLFIIIIIIAALILGISNLSLYFTLIYFLLVTFLI